ncbi:hypothetical protein [Streptomyces cadmiisoli]|uniref:hypothetical protein n=1 Tax=Streptomyces cadmiisoli TaxID=2184053 RepID=UPI00365C9DB3
MIEASEWTGYPAPRPERWRGYEPAAVVWQDGGLWLHHTVHVSEDGARAALTLIAPCDWGCGYVDFLIDTENRSARGPC